MTVLEAADRAGGRARTLREPFADGLYAEAGAMTVSPHCHYTLHYIRELGVDLAPSDLLDTTFSYYLRGRFATPDGTSLARLGLSLNPAEEGMDVAQLMDTYVQSLCRELQPDLDAANWEVTERLALYDRRSVAEVLRDRGASEAAIGLLDPFFLEMRGGDLQSASALSWLRYESSGHSMIKAGTSWSKIKEAPTDYRRPSRTGSRAISTTAAPSCACSRTTTAPVSPPPPRAVCVPSRPTASW